MRRAVLRFSIRSRRRKARLVVDFMARYGVRSVVLSGALGSGTQINESIVERAVIDAAQLALVCDITLHRPSPWKVVLADGRALPFKDQSLDLALANAVIEHVGSEADQVKFVSEHARVGRHWIITTPNRWFPVEAHTSTLLRHWSSAWRKSDPSGTPRRESRLSDECVGQPTDRPTKDSPLRNRGRERHRISD